MKKLMRAIGSFFAENSSDFKEGLLELIITVVLLGIGIGVAALFSVTIDSLNLDSDTFVLIGFVAIACVGVLIGLVKKLIDKMKNRTK